MALLALGGVVAMLLFAPARIAVLRCSDGSVLTVRTVTFGTNHVWHGAHSPSVWTSPAPTIVLWGDWRGASTNTHHFRYQLLDAINEAVEKPWATLEAHDDTLQDGNTSGLLAVTTNAPIMVANIRILEIDDVGRIGASAEFSVKNPAVIKHQSSRPSKWSVRVNKSPSWKLGSDLIIANERTSHEILVEKLYRLGPVEIYRTFN